MADQVAHLAHLNARDTTLVFVSRAPQPDIERLKARMDWKIPWFTITDGFDKDFGVDEWHGTNAFIRDDGDRVFRTYFVNSRGDEAMGSTWNFLDITALGRQEEWEDSPRATRRQRHTPGGTGTTHTPIPDHRSGRGSSIAVLRFRVSRPSRTPGTGRAARPQRVELAGRLRVRCAHTILSAPAGSQPSRRSVA